MGVVGRPTFSTLSSAILVQAIVYTVTQGSKIFELHQPSKFSISSAHNSASMIVGAFVFPEHKSGITWSVSRTN